MAMTNILNTPPATEQRKGCVFQGSIQKIHQQQPKILQFEHSHHQKTHYIFHKWFWVKNGAIPNQQPFWQIFTQTQTKSVFILDNSI